MRFSLHVIKTHLIDSATPSILLHFDSGRYLFNCSEGTQRALLQQRWKLGTLQHIYLSSCQWSAVGGIPGLFLTMLDSSKNQCKIVGHQLDKQFMHSSLFMKELVSFQSSDDIIQDKNLHVQPVLTFSNRVLQQLPHVQEDGERVCKKSKLDDIPPPKPVVSYICTAAQVPRKFRPEKAALLGVPKGVLYHQLVQGHDVVLSNGTTIRPDDCCDPLKPQTIIMLISCPDSSFIDSLTVSTLFEPYYGDIPNTLLIVHMLGEKVFEDVKYQQWIKKFAQKTMHVVSSRDVDCDEILFKSAQDLQNDLNLIDKQVFPELYHSKTPRQEYTPDIPNCILAHCGLTIEIEPELKVIPAQKSEKSVDIIQERVHQEFKEMVQRTKERIQNKTRHSPLPSAFESTHVITLGTGSSRPCNYRNVSSTLLCLPSGNHVLFDSGEGSLGQIMRHFGPERVKEDILLNLKVIFISHLHADHHLGLFSIIEEWCKIHSRTNEKLVLICPNTILEWIQHSGNLDEEILTRLVIVESAILRKQDSPIFPPSVQRSWNQLLQELDCTSIRTALVEHCQEAYGVALDINELGKIVFSGDCRPSQSLVRIGQNATLLIHEATFDDTMKAEAIKKRHSTVSEAIQIGQRMGARCILLTHFSQRYPKFKGTILQNSNTLIGFATDHMHIRLDKMPEISQYPKMMERLFSMYKVEDEATLL